MNGAEGNKRLPRAPNISFCKLKILSHWKAPSFTNTPSPVEGIKGKDASLHCEVYGTPPFQVNWYKDKRPLKESRKYKMVIEASSATLHIMKLELDDAGLYECRVSNNLDKGWQTNLGFLQIQCQDHR
uniref:Ig-like domain-containing protein n=1 Tax=Labrus bergylta TaxID=56723 RepID=A0A3Q3GSD3_9LABR